MVMYVLRSYMTTKYRLPNIEISTNVVDLSKPVNPFSALAAIPAFSYRAMYSEFEEVSHEVSITSIITPSQISLPVKERSTIMTS